MSRRIDNFIIRGPDGVRTASSLALGRGVPLTTTAGGLPELATTRVGETQLMPSGGDDTQAIRDALATGMDVRLGPGTFTISDSLVVGAGGAQRLSGCGAGRTQVRHTTAGIPAVVAAGDRVRVEGIQITGVGSPAGRVGVRAAFPSGIPRRVTLRDLIIGTVQTAIHLERVACDVSGVSISLAQEFGIYASRVRGAIRDVQVASADTHGIHIEQGEGVVCESIFVTDSSESAIFISGGTGYRLSAVNTQNSGRGLHVMGAGDVSIDTLFVSASFLGDGVVIDQVSNAALNACRVRGSSISLLIQNSQNVVAGALLSDHNGHPNPWSHLTVQNSQGVFITGIQVISRSPPPTYEVNVSLAGSRVLFGPHNFAPAHINSGGNFAQL